MKVGPTANAQDENGVGSLGERSALEKRLQTPVFERRRLC